MTKMQCHGSLFGFRHSTELKLLQQPLATSSPTHCSRCGQLIQTLRTPGEKLAPISRALRKIAQFSLRRLWSVTVAFAGTCDHVGCQTRKNRALPAACVNAV